MQFAEFEFIVEGIIIEVHICMHLDTLEAFRYGMEFLLCSICSLYCYLVGYLGHRAPNPWSIISCTHVAVFVNL
jgi:hypothetical protein